MDRCPLSCIYPRGENESACEQANSTCSTQKVASIDPSVQHRWHKVAYLPENTAGPYPISPSLSISLTLSPRPSPSVPGPSQLCPGSSSNMHITTVNGMRLVV
jgi:hypothetical protein